MILSFVHVGFVPEVGLLHLNGLDGQLGLLALVVLELKVGVVVEDEPAMASFVEFCSLTGNEDLNRPP